MAQLREEYPDDVRFAYRHYPLIGTPEEPFHDKAALSTQAAEAAGIQGKFWEMHDAIFAGQNDWIPLTVPEYEKWLAERADELGLDVDKFVDDMKSEELVNLAQQAWEHGQEIGMPGTPFLLFNGNIWPNNVPPDFNNLSAVVKLTLLEANQFTACPPMTIDPTKEYVATIQTEKGDIVLRLFPDEAPLAVNNFVFLARNGWYDGVTFHRVIQDFIAQAGDPTGTGYGGPGYAFANEISPDLIFDRPGLLAMANAGPDSNGSQFFITMAEAPKLDGNYTIFGEVVEGMEVVKSLTLRDPSQAGDLPPGDEIINITIDEK